MAKSSFPCLRSRYSGPGRRPGIGWFFVAALIPGLLAGSILFCEIYRAQRAELEQGALQTARALASAMDRDLAGIRGKLEILAASPSLQSGDLPSFYRHVQDVLVTETLAAAVVLFDGSGQQIMNTLRPFGSDLPKTGHPDLVRKTFETGRPAISDLYVGSVSGIPVVALEVPVFRDGKVVYALDLGIFAERLSRLLEGQNLPDGWGATLIDRQGRIVARSRNAARMVGQKAPPALLEQLERGDEGTLASETLEGTSSFIAFSRSSLSGWSMAVAMDRAVLYRHLQRTLALAGVAMLAFLLGGAFLAWIFTRHLRHALQRLAVATKAGGAGDLEAQAPLVGPREVVDLAEQFNEMQRARKTALEGLRQNQQFSDDIINSLPGIFYMLDQQGRLKRWNRHSCAVSGYAADELARMQARDLFDEATAARIHDRIGDVFEHGESAVEASLLTKDGRHIPYYFTGRRTVIGDRAYLVGLGMDITERKAMEEALAASNKDLRAFLAMLTHELRTPLSVIDAAVQSLEHLHGPDDAAVGLRHRRIRHAVKRINALVEQFLTTDKIDDIGLIPDPARLDAAEQARLAMEASGEAGIERIHLSAPEALEFQGDAALVQLALGNLVDNALKYSPPDTPVAVDIEAREQEGKPGVAWTVSDRGEGIEAASREAVFGKYVRGRSNGHIGGAGLGLYLVRRVAELHGGSIEIIERPGWGGVFRLWLPVGRGLA